jgi:hypothetical protein
VHHIQDKIDITSVENRVGCICLVVQVLQFFKRIVRTSLSTVQKKILDAALQRWHTYQLTKIEQSAKESDISATEKHYLPAKKKEGM